MKDLGPITWVWNLLPWYVQLGAIGYLAFTSIGGTLSIYNFTKSFAGRWAIPAMASLAIPLAFWVYTLLKGREAEPHEHVSGKDAAPVVKAKPKRPTLFGKK
jgi:hypothetical protein